MKPGGWKTSIAKRFFGPTFGGSAPPAGIDDHSAPLRHPVTYHPRHPYGSASSQQNGREEGKKWMIELPFLKLL